MEGSATESKFVNMTPVLRKSVILAFLMFCGINLHAQIDSLTIDSIFGRIREILNEYNSRTIYVDTSSYVHGVDEETNINLQIAASLGACNEIIILRARGADVNNFVGYTATPLHYAVNSARVDAVEILLLLGANPNNEDIYGNTPLITAVRANYPDIAEKLIRFGASLTETDFQRSAPLHHAVALDNFMMTDLLLYYESPTELLDSEGNTPLMAGVCFGYHDIADLLLQSGADPNGADRRGFTPLMAATQNGDTLMMGILIRAGANLYAVNDDGIDALGCAVISSQKEAAGYLLNHGNRWNHGSGTKVDPVKLANSYGEKEILGLMNDHGLQARRELSFSQLSFSGGGWVTSHCQLAGGSLSITEPGLRTGITIGAAATPASQLMLVEKDDGILYQYGVKTNLVYAGLFREYPLSSQLNELRISVIPAVNLGYMFHSLYAGTEERPGDSFRLIPSADLRIALRNLSLNTGLAVMRSPFYKTGPAWLTMKVTYDLKSPQGKFRGKRIRLYTYEQN